MTREEIIKHLHEALDFVDIHFPYRYVFVEAIEALSQPSFPSNLDEAAEEFGKRQGVELAPFARKFFKAGAEWMVGQGITVECGVRVYPTLDEEPHPWVSLYRNGISCDSIKDIPELETLGFKDGDNAIVTIRKKQPGESLKEKK